MAEHNDFGKEGETLAQKFLTEKGYTIRHTNWRSFKHELDIVAETKDFLVVVEVKSRNSTFFGKPEESINNTKIRNIVFATQSYIKQHNITKDIRFDVITIVKQNGKFEINHIENAFHAPLG